MKRLDWKKIKELWEQGLNDGQIAVAIGTNQVVICNIRKRLGLDSKWKRGRQNNEFLKKEIEEKKVVFLKDYTKLEKLKIQRDYSRIKGIIKRIAVPKVKTIKGVPNVKRQVVFFKNDKLSIEQAFRVYMYKFPKEERIRLMRRPAIMTRKANYVRKFFNLEPIYSWHWCNDCPICQRKYNLDLKSSKTFIKT